MRTPATTQGDIVIRGTNSDERVAIGTQGQVLRVNPDASGLEYATIDATSTTPTTTQGDIIIRGTNSDERVAIGTQGQVLRVNPDASGLEYTNPYKRSFMHVNFNQIGGDQIGSGQPLGLEMTFVHTNSDDFTSPSTGSDGLRVAPPVGMYKVDMKMNIDADNDGEMNLKTWVGGTLVKSDEFHITKNTVCNVSNVVIIGTGEYIEFTLDIIDCVMKLCPGSSIFFDKLA